jgi:hypothetical protein
MPGQFVPSPKNRTLRRDGSRVSRTGREESGPLSGPRQIAVRAMYRIPPRTSSAPSPIRNILASQFIAAAHNRTWIQALGGAIRSGHLRAFGVASHTGFPSGRLTSSNEGTWVLSHHDSSIAPQTVQTALPVCGTKNFVSVRLYSVPQLHRTMVAILLQTMRSEARLDPSLEPKKAVHGVTKPSRMCRTFNSRSLPPDRLPRSLGRL